MDNHYHLALRQGSTQPLSRTMRSLLQGYVQFYNTKYGTAGSLFQGRFQSTAVDDPLYKPWHLVRLTRYIHRNPAPFADFTTYHWSSYRQYVRGTPGICDTEFVLDVLGTKRSYATFCENYVPSERIQEEKKYRVLAGRRLQNT